MTLCGEKKCLATGYFLSAGVINYQKAKKTHDMNALKTVLLSAALALIPLISHAQLKEQSGGKEAIRKLQLAEMAISNLYVDEVDDNILVEDAIRGMLEKLDPHSSYTTAKETKSLNEPLNGSFEGVGIQYNMIDDTLVVVQTISKGPSEKVGIMPGDRFVTVNDTAIAGVRISTSDIAKRLRGPKGTKVRLGVARRGVPDMLYFTVVRDKIPIHTIDAKYMITPKTGYICIGSFGANTYGEFMAAVAELAEQGMESLIIDLQNNGGGYLQSAVQITSEFLASGDLVVYTQGRSMKRHDYYVPADGRLKDIKVCVLINEYSASASEIFSGALQDQDRAVIVGRRSFGKGLVQRPIEFDDGSMMRLTVSHYYTPSGRCIQKPFVKGEKEDYARDIERRLKRGELFSPDSIHFADSLRCTTLRKGRTVYGGGGIMPDVFVPLDTTQFTSFYRSVVSRSLIINASMRYVDTHRKQLRRDYPSFESFLESFDIPQTVIDGILSEADKLGVKPKDNDELANSLPMMRLQLKALVARDIWDMNEYYHVINASNRIVQKGLEVIGN